MVSVYFPYTHNLSQNEGSRQAEKSNKYFVLKILVKNKTDYGSQVRSRHVFTVFPKLMFLRSTKEIFDDGDGQLWEDQLFKSDIR